MFYGPCIGPYSGLVGPVAFLSYKTVKLRLTP